MGMKCSGGFFLDNKMQRFTTFSYSDYLVARRTTFYSSIDYGPHGMTAMDPNMENLQAAGRSIDI